MPREKSDGFPVFNGYFWAGQSVDQLFDDASAAKERGEVQSVLEYFSREPSASRVRIEPISAKIVARFNANNRPLLPIELANVELTPRGILAFVADNGVLGCNALPDYLRHISLLRSTICALQFGHETPQSQREFVRAIVNEQLAASAPALDAELRLTSRSDRLIDAIWVQVAKAIDSGRQFGRCERCEKFFEVSGGASRTDRAYCSNACRLAAYRNRKRAALALRGNGATYREIAKELGSTIETVKGWLKGE